MKAVQTEPIIRAALNVQLEIDELVKRLSQGTLRPHIREIAEATLAQVNGIWQPSVSYRWLHCSKVEEGDATQMIRAGGESALLNLGCSAHFLNEAEYALAAIFTVGKKFEAVGRQVSENGQTLTAYIIDVIGLIVLEKMGDLVKSIPETKARELGWGVSPMLSPGSNHGWSLEEQLQLCSLLPIAKLGMKIQSDAVLKPFKSMTCLIGMGPGYSSSLSGSACLTCSRNDDCHLKHD